MYTTVEEVKAEASLSKNNFITDEEVESKINNADSVINAYLSGKYPIPFTTPPYMIKLISTYLAAGYLLKKDYGPMHPGDSKDGDDKIKMGMDMLRDLQKGKITLTKDDGSSLLADDKKVTSSYPNNASSNDNNADYSQAGSMDPNVAGSSGNGPYIKIQTKW